MSNTDEVSIRLDSAEKTAICGQNLKNTLYSMPVDILLYGELGAGKTTFLQGFAKALGILESITSPTYALEQRYQTDHFGELLHIDLYRLSEEQAQKLLEASQNHTGIRCIEWADRAKFDSNLNTIEIHIDETSVHERTCKVAFHDIAFPTFEQIQTWREEMYLPEHIARHCDAVTKLAGTFAEILISQGKVVRPLALQRAGQVHDLLRFVDFKPGASHVEIKESPEQQSTWNEWKEKYQGLRHEEACAQFLQEQGYTDLASIVEVHGLVLPSPERRTIEQQLLFYADKRIIVDEVSSLDERFADFEKRYGHTSESKTGSLWYNESKEVEKHLFPDGIPL